MPTDTQVISELSPNHC